ncbi:MAG: RNA polymerase sigma factor (sigma-70 family) [Saprospiraceae bacterium]
MGEIKIVNIIQKKITHQNKTNEIIIQEEGRAIANSEAEQRKNEQAEIIKALMSQLCKDCRQVLTLFYFHENSMKEIAEKLKYKNANVSKTKKRECLKQLMTLAKEKYQKADFFRKNKSIEMELSSVALGKF